MLAPNLDLESRRPVWDQLQMFFMDTDPSLSLDRAAAVCAESPYSESELEEIFFNEVLPACRFNMLMFPAPEWAGFDLDWLTTRILKKHRFGRSRPLWGRLYAASWWRRLVPRIRESRRAAP